MEKHQDQALNRQLLRGWTVIMVVLSLTYLAGIAKRILAWRYFMYFLPFLLIPLAVSWYIYKKNPRTDKLKYVLTGSYVVMYAYVLANSKTNAVFAYIFPMLSLLILYHSEKIILWLGILVMVMNIGYITFHISHGDTLFINNADAEIQIGCVALAFIFSYLAAKLYGKIHNDNAKYVVALYEKSQELENMTMQTITAIANTIDAKDSYTEGHSQRVAEYSRALAKAMGKNEAECARIYHIALLHDIGKIGVPDSVLHKPGKLTPEEYELIKQHPTIGAKILRDVKAFPGLEIGALYHHERYDGKGYPEGLKGKEIPEIARIICVADTLDAMNTNRVYRKRFSQEYISDEVKRCAGTQFDPEIANVMVGLLQDGTVDDIEKITASRERRLSREGEDSSAPISLLSSLLIDKLADEHSEKYLLDSLADRETFNVVEKDIVSSLEGADGCLMLIDVDNMATLNKEHGFLQGDLILAEIAGELINSDLQMPVCRLEGDEFLCFIPDVSSTDEAKKLVSEISQSLTHRLSMAHEYPVTFSIGAAVSTSVGRKFSSLLYAAEKALHGVKQSGKDRFMMYTQGGMDLRAPDEDALERDLDNISAVIEHRDNYSGAMKVEFEEFGQVYELLRNIGIRNAQSMQLVLFTVEFGDDADIHISERSQVMQYLDKAIVNSVRKVDVTTRYSSTQQLALFSNLPEENLHIVTERIIREFYCMVSESKFQLVYSYRTINFDTD
ncbi:MAG: diguanylate cyclase [Lachnospiraceae bacterium]|nr:diguanylate cyclase [Lachnospiraceae bacterium]